MKPFTKRILILNSILLVLALICLLVCASLSGTLEGQKAAERWSGDGGGDFAQVSCFLPGDGTLDLTGIYTFRQALEARLVEEGLEAPAGGRLYTDAWSRAASLNVSGEHGKGTAAAVAVGGNFFFFHPLRLVSGSYIAEDDYTDDRVVIDRELAWRLYGSDQLAGLTVEVEGVPFVVAGVVERDTDFASKKAQTSTMSLYLSYTAYSRLKSDAEAIDCYEIVLPEPVDGFAENFVKEKFPLNGGALVNNSTRAGLAGARGVLREFGTRSMRTGSVSYPDWENAARCVDDWRALFLALAIVLAVCPVITACVAAGIGLIRGKDYLAEKLPALADNFRERLRKRRYARKNP